MLTSQPGITPLIAKWPGTFPAWGCIHSRRGTSNNGAAYGTYYVPNCLRSLNLSHINATNKMADSSAEDTVGKTIADLETRLRRIEFVTTGQHREQNGIAVEKGSATARLRDLEQKLDQVTSRSRAVQDLLNLCALYPINWRRKLS